MTQGSTDNTGASVTIGVDQGGPVSSFTVSVADGSPVGRADFVDAPGSEKDRIFFHTEVDPEFGGRGLAGLLIRAALEEGIRNGRTVVPVCPLFASHLDKHGDEFFAAGGVFRLPRQADIAVVQRAVDLTEGQAPAS